MSVYKEIWTQVKKAALDAFDLVSAWVGSLSQAEGLLGFVAFILVIMLFTQRRRRKGQHEGDPMFQFVFALTIVVVVGFGATWLLIPS